MKLKLWLLLLPLLGMSVAVSAQSSLPRKVSDVTLLDLNGDPTQLPYWGEKNLMIFYIDPDHHKQNEDFTTDMEENHRVEGENLFGFGVMNLKDAPMIPNGMARNMARKRTASNGATVLAVSTTTPCSKKGFTTTRATTSPANWCTAFPVSANRAWSISTTTSTHWTLSKKANSATRPKTSLT